MVEHRQHARAPIELEVTYRRLNSFFVDYTRNVSKGGMFVRTARPLPPGTRLVFRLTIPGRDDALEVPGEVVHACADGPEAGMGLRFVWPDDAARSAFETTVEGLIQESLGPRAAAALLDREPRR